MALSTNGVITSDYFERELASSLYRPMSSDDDIDGDLYRCALLRRWRGRDVLPYHMARTGLLLFTTSPDDPSTCRAEVELVFEDGVQLEYTFEVKPEPDASTQCFERVEQKL